MSHIPRKEYVVTLELECSTGNTDSLGICGILYLAEFPCHQSDLKVPNSYDIPK